MSSFVSSILHSSANKFDSKYKSKSKDNNNNSKNTKHQINHLSSRLAMHASTPILSNSNMNGSNYYYHPQKSYSSEYVPAPPPYDTQQQLIQHHLQQQQLHSPTPTPSTSWTSEMSALAEKIKDDVTSTFKGSKSTPTSQQMNIDRHSISQGMKLVSIAADEYEEGNESDALGIYLTGVDKILMALPNKTDVNTKMAIREKLQSVEERVGLINIATTQKKIQQQQQLNDKDYNQNSFQVNSFILSRIASTISTISSKAYQSATTPVPIIELDSQEDTVSNCTTPMPTLYMNGDGDSLTKFKRLGQYMIDVSVTCAILVKQSPLPDLISFLFGYVIQLAIWLDSQYHIVQKAQDAGVECIKLGLAADERYRLHEFITEGLYMLIAAGLKAIVAFKEAPRYHESSATHPIDTRTEPKKTTRRDSIPEQNSPNTSPCLPTTPQKTRTSWVWSGW
ncbi:hypothetical protein INT48_009403 [Thamnidium elegans]|uniref:MIT domain-containing protein n=1 Tax=Thamnidium elegans TaxID=101142 RepID=A0A8H7VT22_9FUNG|nr:hypothetical protein INT48_009403 [Thamnidium elegans]